MFVDIPEWAKLSAAAPGLAPWLSRMTARPSFQATSWDRVAAMAG
jgi:hypothetical protein